jgi:hypothetical protein
MKHKVITTSQGKVVIDETADRSNQGFYVMFDTSSTLFSLIDKHTGGYVRNDQWSKIIATINFSIDKDIPVIVVEDEVEKLARREYGSSIYSIEQVEAFKEGYKASQQNGVYSEEDLRKVAQFAQGAELTYVTDEGKEILISKFIQSLNKEYIELETDLTLGNEEDENQNLIPVMCLKTDRVNGQLISYVKQ